jgi:hypothetical protein
MPAVTSGAGHERRFVDVRDESGLPPIPDISRRCGETSFRALADFRECSLEHREHQTIAMLRL